MIRGVAPTDEALNAEARLLRVQLGWFLFEAPSTVKNCDEKKRRIGQMAAAESERLEMPAGSTPPPTPERKRLFL